MSTHVGNIEIQLERSAEQKINEKRPYVFFIRQCFLNAIKACASDIHIEPRREGVDIRLRLLGDLVQWRRLSKERCARLVYEVKRIVGLPIAVNNIPLDSRVSFPSWKTNMRASSLPTIYGEKIVLRLLPIDREFHLENSGLKPSLISELKEAGLKKQGLILISGPTGSGKTTTLYSILSFLNQERRNLITLEDPVEYEIEGLNQVEITKKLSFSSGLRAVLRQDPDVILVGEIRDEETAHLALQAANTGHLVLSTVHANSAAQAIDRLLELGVKKEQVEANLLLSLSQRLIAILCPSCSTPMNSKAQNKLKKHPLLKELGSLPTFYLQGEKSCKDCFQPSLNKSTGLVKRLPIVEIKSFLNKKSDQKEDKSLCTELLEIAKSHRVSFQQFEGLL